MLSRVADSIYWMSRYIERADSVARFIDVNLHILLDMVVGSDPQWMPLVNTTGDAREFNERYGEPTRENVIRFLTFDGSYGSSILSCVRMARENARSVREIISSEMWEQINSFYLMVTDASRRGGTLFSPHDFYGEIRRAAQLFAGITDATMSRGEGWHFYRLGTMLERADKTSRIVDVKYFILLPSVSHVGSPYDDIQWSALLKSTGGLEMYRKQYGLISPYSVVEFLILDRHFPRSVQYCLGRAEESLHAISSSERGTFINLAEQKLGHVRSNLAYTTIQNIIDEGLHECIDGLQSDLNDVGDAIFHTFFEMRPYSSSGMRQSQVSSASP
jgi:uncharacterized alpha-E superfamily protein